MLSIALRLIVVAGAFTGVAAARGALSFERSVGTARVSEVARTEVADLVVLDSGHHAGLRQGMVCVATRDSSVVGELLLVDLRPRAATALILELKAGEALHPGDSVAVKTVSSRK